MSLESIITPLWIVWILQAGVCAANQWAYRRRMILQDSLLDSVTPDQQKAAVVIVPVKGRNADTESFFDSLRTQNYSKYRIIYTLESEADPATAALREHLSLAADQMVYLPAENATDSRGLTSIQIVIAGESTTSGQKVHNQLAAFLKLRETDELIIFADADLHAGSNWLARLTAPLNIGTYQVCTGYRWLIPEASSLPNQIASVINATASTGGGHSKFQLLWGGSSAITREAFAKMDVPAYFEGSLNDDLQLSRAARHAGFTLGYVHSLQLPSPIWFTWPSFFEFARRQYFQVRHYTPRIYRLALIGMGITVVAWLSAIIALCAGHQEACIPIIVVTLLDQIRAAGRSRLRRDLIPEPHLTRLNGTAILEHLATPFWMTLHFTLALSALFMKRVTWAGITYEVHDRQNITIIRPNSSPPQSP